MTVNETNDPRDEKFVEHEEELAAAEAAAIGGAAPGLRQRRGRPRSSRRAGEGEAEGFEEAEEGLIEAASHGENRHNPAEDAFTPEVSRTESGAAYGEADELDTTEGSGTTRARDES